MADDTVKLRDLLPTKLDGLEETIEGDLRKDEDAHFSKLAWRCVRSSAADEVRSALDFDVFQVLAQAWAKSAELFGVSRDTSDEITVVHLGQHDFKTAVHPELTVDFGVPPYPKLQFTLEVAAHFEGAALSIRNGYIIAAETGDASVNAEFKYGKVRLHKEESPKVKLAGRREFAAPGIKIG
jgi:hypothetical protein